MTESAQDLARRLLANSSSSADTGATPTKKAPKTAVSKLTQPSATTRKRRGPGKQFADLPDVIRSNQRKALVAAAQESSELPNVLFLTRPGPNNTVVRVSDPKLAGIDLVNFSTYDYLALSNHPRVLEGARQAIDQYSASAAASRAVGGQYQLQLDLEQRLAGIYDVGDAMVTPSGYLTNTGVIGYLLGPNDVAICDELIHASVISGVQLSGARRLTFRHNDPDSLRAVLRTSRNTFDRALLVLEGHYSMDGTIGRVAEAAAVAREYDCAVMVDEAHSIGVFGAHGRGIREHYGMPGDAVDIWMGTLSKGLASCGGYIAGDTELIGAIKFSAPAFTFTGGPAPATLGAAQAALDVIEDEPQRLTRLWANAAQFHSLLHERGLNLGISEGTPICPVIVPGELRAAFVSSTLLRQGVYVTFIIAPTVPTGQERLRFFVTAEHTPEQLVSTADLLAEAIPQAKQIPDIAFST
ncbi:aminotransferase class I/II-fold pyridoxal phosphate-dependent enzyme [Nocardia sp. 004]|uniref:aminotransferase class I/II-fold pyridoxal phosphate-dependent enzyme n=1 Tax=Nocardia sp. 004 TaxID=3385978 RepID=UPI0039A22199